MDSQNVSFSSLISLYLLKVTKFFVKISQFEFLVRTEKNICVYENILVYIYVKTATLLKKITSLFPSNLLLKVEVLLSRPFLKIWLEVQPLPQQKGGRGTLCITNQLPLFSISRFTNKCGGFFQCKCIF